MLLNKINKKGNPISYEFISSNKIRITAHNIKYHKYVAGDVCIMFDFDGGPVLTKGVVPKIDGCNKPIDKIECVNNEDTIEVMIHLI